MKPLNWDGVLCVLIGRSRCCGWPVIHIPMYKEIECVPPHRLQFFNPEHNILDLTRVAQVLPVGPSRRRKPLNKG